MTLRRRQSLFALLACIAVGCSSTDSTTSVTTTDDAGTDASTSTTGDDAGATGDASTADASTSDGAVSTVDCTDAGANSAQVVCAANAFLATLTTAEQATVVYDWSNAKAKTIWSNLPGVTRNGIKLGALTATSRAAALALAKTVLTDQGYGHLIGVLAGDDYLTSLGSGGGGGGPGGGSYGSDNYSIAFIGSPSKTSDWMLQIGGHHMAYNITYRSGVGYPVPHHLGVEPKAQFTVSGNYAGTYQPLADKGTAIFGIFAGFTADQMTAAYLSGQTFADVLLGPVEYGTGTEAKVVYPSQTGVIVSTLPSAQQDLVTTAIKQWVQDYDSSIADPLLADYTSAAAYAQTYLSYGGPSEGALDPDVNTTYLRIDGPRVWIELSCQAGVVIQGVSHFHTIFRDKAEDYGASL